MNVRLGNDIVLVLLNSAKSVLSLSSSNFHRVLSRASLDLSKAKEGGKFRGFRRKKGRRRRRGGTQKEQEAMREGREGEWVGELEMKRGDMKKKGKRGGKR